MVQAPKRKGGPRSSTGCKTCRKRRVRCSEERPRCAACARLCLSCQYDKDSGPEKPQDAMANLAVDRYQIPFRAPGTPADRKALHYFYVHASVELSSYLSLGFWEGLLLQLCQTDTTVQQAVILVSRAHLDLSNRSSSTRFWASDETGRSPGAPSRRQIILCDENYGHASLDTLEAYQRAVRRLIHYMRKQPKPSHFVVLTCCILLYVFNGLTGNSVHAEVHLSNGLRVLAEMMDGKTTITSGLENEHSAQSAKEAVDALTPILARMDLEDVAQKTQRDLQLTLEADDYGFNDVQRFTSVQDASIALMHHFRAVKNLQAQILRSIRNHNILTPTPAIAFAHAQLIKRMDDWSTGINEYEHSHAHLVAAPHKPSTIETKTQLLEALSMQVLKTDYLLIRRSLVCSLDDFPFNPRTPSILSAEEIYSELLAAARKALELQRTYKQVCDLPRSRQVSAHWSVFDTLEMLSVSSVNAKTREDAAALAREFSPLPAGCTFSRRHSSFPTTVTPDR